MNVALNILSMAYVHRKDAMDALSDMQHPDCIELKKKLDLEMREIERAQAKLLR